jgi:hypothetical protein
MSKPEMCSDYLHMFTQEKSGQTASWNWAGVTGVCQLFWNQTPISSILSWRPGAIKVGSHVETCGNQSVRSRWIPHLAQMAV